jgi:hypothetical protein
MARQEAEKGLNGLRASYVDSPHQINAKNGGANFSYGDALGNGVVYGKEQYMKGAVKANAEAVNSGNAFTKDVSNRAFNVDRIRRAEISNQMAMIFAADKVLQNKEMLAKAPIIKYDNTVLRDGDKNPSVSVMEYNANQARLNSWHQQAAQSTLEAGIMSGGIGVANRTLSFVNRVAPILNDVRVVSGINAGFDVAGQAYDTKGFTEGSYRLDKTLVTVGTSWLSMGAATRFLPATSSLGLQYVGNAGISGLTGVANTAYSNATGLNGDEKSLTEAFIVNAGFGTVGKVSGQFLTNSMQKVNTQTYANTAGARFETSISGLSNFPELFGINYISSDKSK